MYLQKLSKLYHHVNYVDQIGYILQKLWCYTRCIIARHR